MKAKYNTSAEKVEKAYQVRIYIYLLNVVSRPILAICNANTFRLPDFN